MGYTGQGKNRNIWTGRLAVTELEPKEGNDLITKFFFDSNTFWQRVGDVLSPKTDGDDVQTTGQFLGKIDGTIPAYSFTGALTTGLRFNTTTFLILDLLVNGISFISMNSSLNSININKNTDINAGLTIMNKILVEGTKSGVAGADGEASTITGQDATGGGSGTGLGGVGTYTSGMSTIIAGVQKDGVNTVFKGGDAGTGGNPAEPNADGGGIDLNSGAVGTGGTGTPVKGAVNVKTDMIFIGDSTGLVYGEVFVNDNTTVTSVSSSGFTQFLHFDTNGHANLSSPDHTNDHITIDKAGVYMVDCCVNIKNSSGAAHDIEVVIAKNNNASIFPNMRRHRTLGTGSDIGAIPLCGHLDLAVGDTIEVWITSDSGSARDVIGEDVTLMVTMVGGT